MLLGLLVWVWYLTPYMFLYIHYVLIRAPFFRARRGIRMALLLYYGVSGFDVVK